MEASPAGLRATITMSDIMMGSGRTRRSRTLRSAIFEQSSPLAFGWSVGWATRSVAMSTDSRTWRQVSE